MTTKSTTRTFTFLLFLFLLAGPRMEINAQVTYRDTIITWRHFDYSLDEHNGMDTYSTSNIIDDQYPGIVIENEFVRLVVMPEFGARILSFYYKPTGHEQFYLNAVGTPYGMGDGNFYYDWLMVMGGVFPTFPEPEHGKTWFLPWQWELSEISNNRISLKMEISDTIDFPYHPGKFDNGVTEIKCISELTLEAGKAGFDLQHTLINPKNMRTSFEYWTCTTLAPGSQPGNTFTPANSEIIAPIDYVYLKDDWWGWMGNAEEPAQGMGSHVFEYENLAFYSNWSDMGIAYAHPQIEANFYGVINHENEVGVYRVADNSNITGGMKFWTWGASQGLNADPENFYHQARPYIELWSGLSTQFFQNAYIEALDTISWVESYVPSIGLESANNVNEFGAIYLDHLDNGNEQLIVKSFMAMPETEFKIEISLNGISNLPLYDGYFISDPMSCQVSDFFVDDYNIDEGDYILSAQISDTEGNLLIESLFPVTIPFSSYGIDEQDITMPKLIRMADQSCKLEFTELAEREIGLFSMRGELIDIQRSFKSSVKLKAPNPGLYLIRINENKTVYTIKVVF